MSQFIIAQCLLAMGVSRPTQKFVPEVLATWMTVRGRFNFANLIPNPVEQLAYEAVILSAAKNLLPQSA